MIPAYVTLEAAQAGTDPGHVYFTMKQISAIKAINGVYLAETDEGNYYLSVQTFKALPDLAKLLQD